MGSERGGEGYTHALAFATYAHGLTWYTHLSLWPLRRTTGAHWLLRVLSDVHVWVCGCVCLWVRARGAFVLSLIHI